MDNIILFLALFSLTATAAQVSLFRRWWQQLLLAAAIAGITYSFYPTAIEFSSSDIETLLADSMAMLDLSVVLVIEAVVENLGIKQGRAIQYKPGAGGAAG